MIVLLFVIALPPAQQLQKAEEAYDSYEYAKAIPMLEQLLRDNPQFDIRAISVRDRGKTRDLDFSQFELNQDPFIVDRIANRVRLPH